jgi:hypothetical protein
VSPKETMFEKWCKSSGSKNKVAKECRQLQAIDKFESTDEMASERRAEKKQIRNDNHHLNWYTKTGEAKQMSG